MAFFDVAAQQVSSRLREKTVSPGRSCRDKESTIACLNHCPGKIRITPHLAFHFDMQAKWLGTSPSDSAGTFQPLNGRALCGQRNKHRHGNTTLGYSDRFPLAAKTSPSLQIEFVLKLLQF